MPRRRTIRIAALVCLLAFLTAMATAWVVFERPSIVNESRSRRESIELLSRAADAHALQEAVGGLGLFVGLPSGEWVAIRYQDSHYAPGTFSLAVARCSDGSWYSSQRHFCGMLGAYEWCRRSVEELPAEYAEGYKRELEDEHFAPLRRLAAGPDLTAAKASLDALGFTPMSSPRR